MPRIIISDTSCLVILEKIGELDLLRKLFGILPAAKPLLEEIRTTNFGISADLETTILQKAGE